MTARLDDFDDRRAEINRCTEELAEMRASICNDIRSMMMDLNAAAAHDDERDRNPIR